MESQAACDTLTRCKESFLIKNATLPRNPSKGNKGPVFRRGWWVGSGVSRAANYGATAPRAHAQPCVSRQKTLGLGDAPDVRRGRVGGTHKGRKNSLAPQLSALNYVCYHE